MNVGDTLAATASEAVQRTGTSFSKGIVMVGTPWFLVGIAAVVLAAVLAAAVGTELVLLRRWQRQTARPGWWAPVEEQQRLQQILQRNPSYDERTGLTSDPELARWLHDNQP